MLVWLSALSCCAPLGVCAACVMAAFWLLNVVQGGTVTYGGMILASTALLAAPLASAAAVQTLSRWSLREGDVFGRASAGGQSGSLPDSARTLALLAALVTFLGLLCSRDAVNVLVMFSRGDLPSAATVVSGVEHLTWFAGGGVGVAMGGVLLCEFPARVVAAICGVRSPGGSSTGAGVDSLRWILSVLVLVIGWSLLDEAVMEAARGMALAFLGRGR